MAESYKVLFIAGVEHLRVSEYLGRGDRFNETFLTNDSRLVDSLLTPLFRKSAGMIETDFLLSCPLVAYSLEEVNAFRDETAAIDYLNNQIAKLEMFFQNLWLIADNSANVEFGYAEWPYRGDGAITRNSTSAYFTRADGSKATLTVDRQQLREARAAHVSTIPTEARFAFASSDEGGMSKWTRALYFLQAARAQSRLAAKISAYISAFEALFSTDTAELSHKLAERIACFLHDDLEGRKTVVRAIKAAYGFRSRTVHGGVLLSQKSPELEDASRVCDDLLRRCMARILSGTDSLQSWFLRERSSKDFEDAMSTLERRPV